MKVGKLRKAYEKKMAEEIEGLPEETVEKIIKIIHLVRKEFLEKGKGKVDRFRRARGAWKNVNVGKIYKKLNEDWEKWEPIKSV